jgi:membrane dipeptidase
MTYDSHVDTPSELLRLRDISIDNKDGQVDFPKLRRGGVDGSFFALYTSAELTPEASTLRALQMISAVYDVVEASGGKAALTSTPAQAAKNKEKGVFSVFVGMENGSPIGESLSLLRTFYRLGTRYLTLTHNGDNAIADSAAEGKTWGGLSPFGREVVAEMNRLGMMVDLSHASDATFYDCIRYSKAPVVATHSCCRALCSHRRNLTDDMLRALADVDGYVGINFYPYFLTDSYKGEGSPLPGVKEIVDHIDHAVEICGINHVGIGSDFDGIEVTPAGLEDVSKMPLVFEEMSRRGYSRDDVNRVSGANLMAVLDRVIKCSE